mmetsp:Transcript_11226/g.20328  ORF Transcript_11226/g.20328 Transcript_11226/m.20328 type:complete len:234 (-) Transcript_11226:457-1158(-)|eukprot:CAMPEP_0175066634 /NCGR_PEP_ID=MMETSP0052_2-20121109/16628_1 /TAXON_ID=51329 ORGANISM="Polytomella parva, Strain SAG 63-3" /NCGR_SAMPLE_ID=MMETSP0052_2 /ASSEMBLY_ACC=CAM_ASM_000194 /LENGTH=233 /DNA_ID=CAMNT_0016333379 /DNA_START=129 /DNA_END=830 /DNA_ORIENTATION=-
MFKKLFGSTKAVAESIPPPSNASVNRTINTIQSLIDNEENLEKRKALLEKRVDGEVEKSKEFLRQKKKAQALQCLKKKKLLEAEITNLNNMIMRVAEQRMMLEGQRTTVEVVSNMHAAALTAKDNMKVMKIESVDRVIDEINETNDQMRQLNEVFANPLGAGNDLDEDELLGELEELEAEEIDRELLEPAVVPISKTPALPSVPAKMPAKTTAAPAKTDEELELEKLQAEMAL